MINRLLVLILSGLSSAIVTLAADVQDSEDPAGMKRYEGSEIIGYPAPKFDEFLLCVEAHGPFNVQALLVLRCGHVGSNTFDQRARCCFSWSMTVGYDGFPSTVMTRGRG
jgi:hypothetical protein